MQEPKRPDFISVFMGCIELQFFGGIWGWGGVQPYLVFGEKDEGTQNLLVKTTVVSGREKSCRITTRQT